MGPNEEPTKSSKSGEAAHICAAAPEGPRYDLQQTDEERRGIENSMWLCGGCHPLIDTDWKRYDAETLRNWKAEAERRAQLKQLGVKPVTTNQPISQPWPRAQWSHETTEDASYVARDTELSRLANWYNQSSVRCISLVGLGGIGKTSLVGYWLKQHTDGLARDVAGLFYWSFYADRDTSRFIKSLCRFIEPTYNKEFNFEGKEPIEAFLEALPHLPAHVVVLDGLEVRQESMNQGQAHGAFIDVDLRDWMLSVTSTTAPWIVIGTSRFPLTDLSTNPKTKTLPLKSVTDEEGAEILHQQSVFGEERDRQQISRYLEGHPLALRLFAATLSKEFRSSPLRHLATLFEQTADIFSAKLHRLLSFYQKSINTVQNALVSALSILTAAAESDYLVRFSQRFLGRSPELHDWHIELGKLVAIGLVLRDATSGHEAYSCHPVIRDFFRDQLLEANPSESANAASSLVTDKPGDIGLVGATNLEPLIIAVETYLDLGSMNYAKEIYANRLEKGGAFLALGFPKDGRRTCEAFLRAFRSPNAPRMHHSGMISPHRNLDLIHFLNGAIEFSIHLGEYADAEDNIQRALQSTNTNGPRRSIPYRAQARICFRRGDFSGAIENAQRAISALTGAVQAQVVTEVAMARYERIKSYAYCGQTKKAIAELKELKLLGPKLGTIDEQALIAAGDLWLCLLNRDLPRLERVISKLKGLISSTANQALVQELLLLKAEAMIVNRSWEGASVVLRRVYVYATKQNCPYELCKSQLLIERLNHASKGIINIDRVSAAIDISISSGFKALHIDGLRLLELHGAADSDEAQHHADLISYRWASLCSS